MDLTLAEFSCFSIKSKQKILNYKAMHISSLALNNGDTMLLYTMNGQFITMQINQTTGKPVSVDTIVHKDILYLFAEKNKLSGLLN
jgi:hypothetical protein